MADVTYTYDAAVSSAVQISAGYTDFFDSNEDLNRGNGRCVVDSCELLQSDCVTAFTETSKVYMNSAHPFEIFMYQNVAPFSFDLCVKCTHEANTPLGDSKQTVSVTD